MPKITFEKEPTITQITAALVGVPAWPGSGNLDEPVFMDQYAQYVHSIKNTKGNKPTWNLYVGVDGRIRIMTDAHVLHGETYDESITAGGSDADAKFFVAEIQIYSTLWGRRSDQATAVLGGYDGGAKGADQTNPIENSITSARGRVIGAFGVGILPCQGTASAEELADALKRDKSDGEKSKGDASSSERPQSNPPAKKAPPKKKKKKQPPAKKRPPSPAPDDDEQPDETLEPKEQPEPEIDNTGDAPELDLSSVDDNNRRLLAMALRVKYTIAPSEEPPESAWARLPVLIDAFGKTDGVSIPHDPSTWEAKHFSQFINWAKDTDIE